MYILFPGYEPRASLPRLVSELLHGDPRVEVLVVDDGSDAAFAGIFDAVASMGARVVHHERNLGKGAALKTGFRYISARHPSWLTKLSLGSSLRLDQGFLDDQEGIWGTK